jgi:hypothetical protein
MTGVYVLQYDRAPKRVEGDLEVLTDGRAAIVVTTSPFRIREALRTDRPMAGPFAYSPSIR